MTQHHHSEDANKDDRRRTVVAAHRWWDRYGWLRWLFSRGGENAGRLAASFFIAGVGAWTLWDTYEARSRGKFLLPIANVERLSPSTFAYVIQGADAGGRRVDFDLIVANKDFSWQRGSTEKLERSGKALSLEVLNSVLFDELVRARLRVAKELIAVGTASQEGDPTEETYRAGQRAEQTAKWVKPVLETGIPIWTLNLGQYRDPCTACETSETAWQRPFLLVAVRRAAWGVDLAEALADALGSASNLPSPDRYSTFGLSRYR
ncbi:MAG: hypothetical protein KDJ37_06215 [Hyphomicrobiaceae bacterium]|nr:hypothetical protein [Hyphomicrobiaceae bacterium]